VDVNGDVMTGALGIIAGSAGSPGLYFSGDTNTGIYSPGADQVAISTNGTGRLFVDSSGSVGVGTASPQTYAGFGALTLNGSTGSTLRLEANGTNALTVQASSSTDCLISASAAGSSLALQTANTERLRITSAGLVGVGTSSPSNKVTIYEAAANPLRLIQDHATSSAYGIDFYSQASTPYTVSSITASHGAAYVNPYLDINVADTSRVLQPRLRIDASGRVGVGTTSPGEEVHIAAASNPYIQLQGTSGTTGSALFGFNSATGGASIETTGNIRFAIPGSESARIDSSGRLLVGTSSARSNFFGAAPGVAPQIQLEGGSTDTSTLSITRNSNDADGPTLLFGRSRGTGNTAVQSGDRVGRIEFHGNDATSFVRSALIEAFVDGTPGADDMPGRLVFSTTGDGASSPTEALRITSGQNIRVGTTAEGSGFTTGRVRLVGNTGGINSVYTEQSVAGGYCYISNAVSNGGTFYHLNFYEAGTSRGSITSNGSSTTYSTSSDYRLKENILPIDGAIGRLLSLKPSQFNFISSPDRTVDGFIAHEVQAVVPEAIVGEKDAVDDDGNPVYQGIDQSKLVPLLTAALQEAIGRIETLEAEVAALKA
jgi:hypothetical protein